MGRSRKSQEAITPRDVIRAFGRNVRAYRLASELSQPELAFRSRCTWKWISQIERGVSNPSLASMVLVANALGCHVADLLRPHDPRIVTVRTQDIERARSALAVLTAVVVPRTRQTRKARTWNR
jgi:transcriptional regulator with XRE-family HTH domain